MTSTNCLSFYLSTIANIIESYFGTQVFSLCFEIYYFLRTFTGNDEFLQGKQGSRHQLVVSKLYSD